MDGRVSATGLMRNEWGVGGESGCGWLVSSFGMMMVHMTDTRDALGTRVWAWWLI